MKLPSYDWDDLKRRSERVVEECLAELPDALRDTASRVTCLYHRFHPNAPHVDPEAMYVLGDYGAYDTHEVGVDDSGVISLYMGAIAWYCEDEELEFEDEVRTTFLHELGHHFGWDEDEVEERGL